MANDTNNPVPEIDLTAQWRAERCPIIDGIVFGDGSIKLVNANWQKQENGRLGIVLKPGGGTTLAELHAKGRLQWTGVIGQCEAVDVVRNIRVIGGEGGLGSDGFVANVRDDDGKVVWLAFFNISNPFATVQIHDDHVLARTTLETWWRFPLDAPDRIMLL